jgi:hypothetical protein
MSNTFKVIDMVGKEALRIAHEKASFIGCVDRQYDESFKDNGKGKQGATLRVRNPNQYTRRTGSRVMDVQDQNESTQTITVATQDGVDMRFNSAELIQSVNSGAAFDDLSKNYIEPAISMLVSGIESDFIAYCTKATAQAVGNPGTALTTLEYPGKARAKLNQRLAPKNDRCLHIDSVNMAAMVNGMSAYFNPSSAIGDQFKEGLIARTAMADYYEQEKLWSVTHTDDVTFDTDNPSLVTDGGSTLDVHTLLALAKQVVGMVFTVAGVYDCNPETKAPYPHLKQFTLTSTSASGACGISPATYLTGARKNVCSSTGADLAITDFAGKTCTVVGSASATYVQPIMFQKEAFQFITADLPLMDDAQKCTRVSKDGLSMRVWMGSDIRNDELLLRLDILYGMAALRPQWACRLIGAANA